VGNISNVALFYIFANEMFRRWQMKYFFLGQLQPLPEQFCRLERRPWTGRGSTFWGSIQPTLTATVAGTDEPPH